MELQFCSYTKFSQLVTGHALCLIQTGQLRFNKNYIEFLVYIRNTCRITLHVISYISMETEHVLENIELFNNNSLNFKIDVEYFK